ncbi:hypothetical protein AVEN_100288-1, partial [Araneus ventricosus]
MIIRSSTSSRLGLVAVVVRRPSLERVHEVQEAAVGVEPLHCAPGHSPGTDRKCILMIGTGGSKFHNFISF